MKVHLLTLLLLCTSLLSLSCTDKDNKIIDHLENTSVNLLDFGLYRLSEDFEIIEVSSDDKVYSLAGYARLSSDSDNKRVINIKIDNIDESVTYKSKPKNKSKANLLCIDSIKHVRFRLNPINNYSFMKGYFSVSEKKGKELDEATTIITVISYENKNNALVVCSGTLLGKTVEVLEN